MHNQELVLLMERQDEQQAAVQSAAADALQSIRNLPPEQQAQALSMMLQQSGAAELLTPEMLPPELSRSVVRGDESAAEEQPSGGADRDSSSSRGRGHNDGDERELPTTPARSIGSDGGRPSSRAAPKSGNRAKSGGRQGAGDRDRGSGGADAMAMDAPPGWGGLFSAEEQQDISPVLHADVISPSASAGEAAAAGVAARAEAGSDTPTKHGEVPPRSDSASPAEAALASQLAEPRGRSLARYSVPVEDTAEDEEEAAIMIQARHRGRVSRRRKRGVPQEDVVLSPRADLAVGAPRELTSAAATVPSTPEVPETTASADELGDTSAGGTNYAYHTGHQFLPRRGEIATPLHGESWRALAGERPGSSGGTGSSRRLGGDASPSRSASRSPAPERSALSSPQQPPQQAAEPAEEEVYQEEESSVVYATSPWAREHSKMHAELSLSGGLRVNNKSVPSSAWTQLPLEFSIQTDERMLDRTDIVEMVQTEQDHILLLNELLQERQMKQGQYDVLVEAVTTLQAELTGDGSAQEEISYLKTQLWAVSEAAGAESRFRNSMRTVVSRSKETNQNNRVKLNTLKSAMRKLDIGRSDAKRTYKVMSKHRAKSARELVVLQLEMDRMSRWREKEMRKLALWRNTRLAADHRKHRRGQRYAEISQMVAGDLDEVGEQSLRDRIHATDSRAAMLHVQYMSAKEREVILARKMKVCVESFGSHEPDDIMYRWSVMEQMRRDVEHGKTTALARLERLKGEKAASGEKLVRGAKDIKLQQKNFDEHKIDECETELHAITPAFLEKQSLDLRLDKLHGAVRDCIWRVLSNLDALDHTSRRTLNLSVHVHQSQDLLYESPLPELLQRLELLAPSVASLAQKYDASEAHLITDSHFLLVKNDRLGFDHSFSGAAGGKRPSTAPNLEGQDHSTWQDAMGIHAIEAEDSPFASHEDITWARTHAATPVTRAGALRPLGLDRRRSQAGSAGGRSRGGSAASSRSTVQIGSKAKRGFDGSRHGLVRNFDGSRSFDQRPRTAFAAGVRTSASFHGAGSRNELVGYRGRGRNKSKHKLTTKSTF